MAHLRRFFLLVFNAAIPIQPPPLRGTSFHRKEGVSTRAPSPGRGCRAQRGGVGFPFGRRSGALVNDALETIFFALFHTARTLSGSLRSPPSPRGEGFVSRIPLPPSNLRPFGAPPSIGRREYPREPLPLEGAAERSEAGLASLFWRRSRLLSAIPIEEGFAGGNGILVSSSIPRKNDRLLRAAVFMCITCLGKRPCRLHLRIADGRKEVVEVAGTLREKGS